jgi:acetyltransferase-like isoleucine patch superfamily enzyme
MIHFRARDFVSVILYRLFMSFFFDRFGRGVRVIWPLRIVGSRFLRLGEEVTLQYGAYIAILWTGGERPLLDIGSGSQVGNYSHVICTRRIEIGERVLIADRVYIADNRHEYEDVRRAVMDQPLRQLDPVSIGSGSWIGENVCILGCRIGKNCVIGANSVVTRDIPDYCVALGCPAVPVKRYCEATGKWREVSVSGEFAD